MDNAFSFKQYVEDDDKFADILRKYNEHLKSFKVAFENMKSYKYFLNKHRDDKDIDVFNQNISFIQLLRYGDIFYIQWDGSFLGETESFMTKPLTIKQIDDFFKNGDEYYEKVKERYERIQNAKNNEYIDPDKEERELYERLKKKYEKS